MNVFLAAFRRISLGGIVLLILSIALKGGLPAGNLKIALLLSPLIYIIAAFFTWLSVKHMTDYVNDELGTVIPSNSFVTSLFRGLVIDIVSPIGVLVGLFGDMSTRVIMFVITYVIILACVGVWFFVL